MILNYLKNIFYLKDNHSGYKSTSIFSVAMGISDYFSVTC